MRKDSKYSEEAKRKMSEVLNNLGAVIEKIIYDESKFKVKKMKRNKLASDLMKSLGKKPRKGKVFKCPVCGKLFYSKPSQCYYRVCCSRECNFAHQRKGKPLKCKFCEKEYYVPPGQIKWRGSSFCSKKCMGNWKSENAKKENSPNWQGGKSNPYRRLRSSKAFKVWREQVFTRDNWTCQACGNRSGAGNPILLHPHHIKSFTQYPELRFDISNGKTLW